MLKNIITLLFLSASFYCHAQYSIAKECVGVKNDQKRLVCYDNAIKKEISNKSNAKATSEVIIPLEIKGFKLGVDAADTRKRLREDGCAIFDKNQCMRSGKYEKENNDLDTFAGQAVISLLADFDDEKLVKISIAMSSDAARAVFLALTEKYGQGMYEESEVKTKSGTETLRTTRTWKNGDDILIAASPAGKIDEMNITLVSSIYLQKRENQRKEKASKDL